MLVLMIDEMFTPEYHDCHPLTSQGRQGCDLRPSEFDPQVMNRIGSVSVESRDIPKPRIGPPPEIRPGAHNNGRVTTRGRSLLNGLEELFLAQGFTAFTLGDLADQLGCSRRSLYALAPTKDELVVLVVDRILRRLGLEAHDSARRGPSRIDQIYTYMHSVATGLNHASRQFTVDMQQMPAVQRVFHAHTAHAVSVVEALIERGVSEGEFQPVHAAFVAELLAAGLRCVLAPGVLEANDLTLGKGLDELAGLFSHGLLSSPVNVPEGESP